MICQTRAKIISAFERHGMRIKQFRKPEVSFVDEALLKYFKQERSDTTSERSSSHDDFISLFS